MRKEFSMTIESSVRLIAGIVVLLTVAGGFWLTPWFFLFTALMGANLVQSGFTNWCPMMPVLRSLGIKDAAASERG
jgi:predicted CDP-diglyceride synthetase/phosphatidate cytidylyltransferase